MGAARNGNNDRKEGVRGMTNEGRSLPSDCLTLRGKLREILCSCKEGGTEGDIMLL